MPLEEVPAAVAAVATLRERHAQELEARPGRAQHPCGLCAVVGGEGRSAWPIADPQPRHSAEQMKKVHFCSPGPILVLALARFGLAGNTGSGPEIDNRASLDGHHHV